MTKSQFQNDDFTLSKKERYTLSSILALASVLTTLDVYEDWLDGAPLSHIIPEVFIIFLSVGVAAYLVRSMLRARRKNIEDARLEISVAKEAAESWKARADSLSKGLSEAISAQFDEWGLSPAEQEVSYLLLKGLSICEIAQIREISERTIRQQASQVYKKSGLSGRAQLSAFFMEDLFDR